MPFSFHFLSKKYILQKQKHKHMTTDIKRGTICYYLVVKAKDAVKHPRVPMTTPAAKIHLVPNVNNDNKVEKTCNHCEYFSIYFPSRFFPMKLLKTTRHITPTFFI